MPLAINGLKIKQVSVLVQIVFSFSGARDSDGVMSKRQLTLFDVCSVSKKGTTVDHTLSTSRV